MTQSWGVAHNKTKLLLSFRPYKEVLSADFLSCSWGTGAPWSCPSPGAGSRQPAPVWKGCQPVLPGSTGLFWAGFSSDNFCLFCLLPVPQSSLIRCFQSRASLRGGRARGGPSAGGPGPFPSRTSEEQPVNNRRRMLGCLPRALALCFPQGENTNMDTSKSTWSLPHPQPAPALQTSSQITLSVWLAKKVEMVFPSWGYCLIKFISRNGSEFCSISGQGLSVSGHDSDFLCGGEIRFTRIVGQQ